MVNLTRLNQSAAYKSLLRPTLAYTEMALAGFAYDFLFQPVSSQNNDQFWSSRTKNGVVGALTFGSLGASTAGLTRLDTRLYGASTPWKVHTFRTDLVRHALAGATAGIVNAESRSLLERGELAPLPELAQSVYVFSTMGAAMRTKQEVIGRLQETRTLSDAIASSPKLQSQIKSDSLATRIALENGSMRTAILPAHSDFYSVLTSKADRSGNIKYLTGTHTVTVGLVVAAKGANVTALGESVVIALDGAQVTAKENTRVQARNAAVDAHNQSHVVADGYSRVTSNGEARVEARGATRVLCRDTSQVDASENAVITGSHRAKVSARGESKVSAIGQCEVIASDFANVDAHGLVTVENHGTGRIQAFDSATVKSSNGLVLAFHDVHVNARGSCQVKAFDTSVVRAFDRAHVEASQRTHTTLVDNSTATVYGNASVECSANSRVEAFQNARVWASGRSRVTARDTVEVVGYCESRTHAGGTAHVELRHQAFAIGTERSTIAATADQVVTALGNSDK